MGCNKQERPYYVHEYTILTPDIQKGPNHPLEEVMHFAERIDQRRTPLRAEITF